ncbi:MAG: right-handed parallel beta-helix repeat-containing protein [Bacteroidales bacterium]
MNYQITRAIFLAAVILLFSCKKDDEGPQLVAQTGPDAMAGIGDTVRLDLSASTGSDYQILWHLKNQPGKDTIVHAETDSAYFIPLSNGIYQVQLTLTKGDLSDKDYQNIDVSGAVLLPDVITEDTRLQKIALDFNADYRVPGELQVLAKLSIDPNVIIEFANGASLVVKNGGNIFADNTTFKAIDSSWKGINVGTTANTFANCVIEDAGNASFTGNENEKAAIMTTGNATLAFSGNTLRNSGGYGIIVKDNSDFFFDNPNQVYPYTNNRFENNASGPMLIPVYVLSDLDGQNFDEETPGTYIELYESAYSALETKNPLFSDMGIAYRVKGILTFNKDLGITRGVEMYFDQEGGIRVDGVLTVSGHDTAMVYMNGMNPIPGAWKGIHVMKGHAGFTYVNILNAGGSTLPGQDETAALIVEQTLSMDHCTVSGSGGIGIHLPGEAHIQFFDNFKDNIIENNLTAAVRIRMDDVNKVVNGNTIRSVSETVAAVEVHMGLDDPLGTWINLDAEIDYKIIEPLKIKATKDLVIEAGSTIQLLAGRYIEVSGGLHLNGQSGTPVTFEGTESKKGHWDGIFLNGTQEILITHVVIRDGGGALEDKGNVIVESTAANVTISNSEIVNSKGYGVLIKSGASDFGINDPASNNTLEGDLGGFYMESK